MFKYIVTCSAVLCALLGSLAVLHERPVTDPFSDGGYTKVSLDDSPLFIISKNGCHYLYNAVDKSISITSGPDSCQIIVTKGN